MSLGGNVGSGSLADIRRLLFKSPLCGHCRHRQCALGRCIYVRFRVAEFIQRLYNEGQGDYVRNFSERETYHLGLFFAKLERTYERSRQIRRTYGSIRRMLLEGAERSIKCPWQSKAVTLDCRGQLLYCAPRSPVLGSCLEESALIRPKGIKAGSLPLTMV